jgi:hypothetical protein
MRNPAAFFLSAALMAAFLFIVVCANAAPVPEPRDPGPDLLRIAQDLDQRSGSNGVSISLYGTRVTQIHGNDHTIWRFHVSISDGKDGHGGTFASEKSLKDALRQASDHIERNAVEK